MLRRILHVKALCWSLAAAGAGSVAPAGCASNVSEGRFSGGEAEGGHKDVSAELCEAWLKGRMDRWCTTPDTARSVAARGAEELGCPIGLDPAKAGKKSTVKRSGPKRATTAIVLLTATAATASNDCGAAMCCYAWVYGNRPRGFLRP